MVKVMDNRRTCWVGDRRALFHGWANEAYTVGASPMIGGSAPGQIWNVYGIVEYEDGSVSTVEPCLVHFADTRKRNFDRIFSPQHTHGEMRASNGKGNGNE